MNDLRMSHYSRNDREKLIAFGLRLKKHRLQKNLSQEELADLCGLHRTYIGSSERGERNVSLLNIEKLAAALNIDVCILVSD